MKYPRIMICIAIMICMSLACVSGCGKKAAEEPVDSGLEEYEDYEEDYYEEYDDYEEVSEGPEEPVDYEADSEEASEEVSKAAVEKAPLAKADNVIELKTVGVKEDTSSDLFEESYADLVDCYNSVFDLYQSDEVPQNDDIEEVLNQVKTMIDEIGDMDRRTISSDEDQVEMLNYMADITQILQETVVAMQELVESETITEDDAEVFNMNFEIMVNNYNNLAEYFNQDGVYMSASQESSMEKASRWIDDISARGFNFNTRDELMERNNELLEVINLLHAIWDSIG